MTGWLLGLFGAGCTISAVTLLYRSWSRRPHGSRVNVLGAWTLLGAAAACWVALDGWEFGTIYAITVPSVVALPLLWLVADRRVGRANVGLRQPLGRPSWADVRCSLLTCLLVVVLGVVASTLITSAVGLLLPFGELDQMVFIVCVMPVLWGLTAFWLSMETRRLRAVLSLVALSAVSLLVILVR